ncbi:hypothetical protein ACNVED_02570 [Legionella sp. D16C41]|uniref:hypothetical protein n=1 Tax=Legionella sp. D16C41 TaxID=3402688 RepID=UPI003AF7D93E
MLTENDIKQILELGRSLGKIGLSNGVSAQMPKLIIDILKPPKDFIGVNSNPAIFVNKSTYQYWGKKHKNWIVNETIAIKDSFLKQPKLEVIGAIVHEIGHAFNVAANIANTEANAYIFEIEVLNRLIPANLELFNNISDEDIKSYFAMRLPYYKQAISSNAHLTELVDQINRQFNLDPNLFTLTTFKAGAPDVNKLMFFQQKRDVENELILVNLALSTSK